MDGKFMCGDGCVAQIGLTTDKMAGRCLNPYTHHQTYPCDSLLAMTNCLRRNIYLTPQKELEHKCFHSKRFHSSQFQYLCPVYLIVEIEIAGCDNTA